jgi:YhcH/YjgK/YiaL family protein
MKRLEENIYPEAIMKGLKYIQDTDFSAMEFGKYEIEGEDIFAFYVELDTKTFEVAQAEVHDEYLDIQYLMKGKEMIGFAQRDESNVVDEDMLEEKDLLFYKGDIFNEILLPLNEGDFAIFFPEDVHRPLCKSGDFDKVTKVIIKIRMSETVK